MKRVVLNYLAIVTLIVSTALIVTSCEKVKDVLLERFTVTFNLNYAGSPAASTVKVEEGKKVSEPSKPTRTGWEFAGWFKESTVRTAWNFDTEVITSDITLYAKWSEITYTVTFNSNSGSAVSSQTVSHGGKVNEPNVPTRAGYRFDGWYKDNTTFANAWSFASETVTANITLYAKWTQLFTVTFDTDGGSEAPASQIIGSGEKINKPDNPTKFKAGLYTGTVKAEDVRCTFEGWYNGATEWNFATDVVTANITLTAKWTGGGTPIAAVAANDIPTSFTYMNNNAGTYTLMLNRDVSISAQQALNYAQRHLTIVGLGGERKITYTDNSLSSGAFFLINNADASLTIDENITLTSSSIGSTFLAIPYLVHVQAGNLIMKAGSRMTGRYCAVYVNGVNSRFTMESGEIDGNTYGVFAYNNASFAMSGGRITGNTAAADVLINYNVGTFTLSGNAEIGALMLNKENNGANSSVTIGTGGFTGIVSALNLQAENSNITNVVDQWTTGVTVPTVMNGAVNTSVLSRFTLGKFVSSNNYMQDISPAYKLDIVDGVVKLVWR